ncbi:CBS domain-containing protein [Rivularia sp. PCC 7116]|nr:CBS domain-containing protein [Rivularia sp. PCC 7116]
MNLQRVRIVSEVMQTEVAYISPTVSVLHIPQMMAEKKVSFVVVAEEESEEAVFPVGIITERDIEQIQALKLDLENIEAQTVMSAPLLYVHPNDSLLDARLLMQRKYVQQLLVVGMLDNW